MKFGRFWMVLAFAVALPGCKWAFAKIAETLHFVARYDNGVPKKEGTLQDGQQTGKWTFYYDDGRKRAEGDYADDHQVGAWTSWYENGRVEWEGGFDERGARTGLWTFFHDNGQQRAVGRYDNDLEQGRWTFRGRDGKLQKVGDFLDARMVGLWSYLGPDGKPTAEGLVFDGERVGPWTIHKDGAVVTDAYPVPDGMGLVRETWPDGSLRRIGLQRDGAPVGGWASFNRAAADAIAGAGLPLRMSCVFAAGAIRSFFAAVPGDSEQPLAEGTLAGSDLVAWRARQDGAPKPQDRAPLPKIPPSGGEWSSADLAGSAAADAVVATWIAELRAPATALPAAVDTPATQPQTVADNPRIPAAHQPDWTVLEDKELQEHVQQYLVHRKQPPASHSRYSIPAAMQGKPRHRADLEGHPFPIKELRATDGSIVHLADFHGKKRVLVVVLRGFFGQVCVYCVAQTEALAQCHDRFDALNLEVLILYPGPEGNEEAFLRAYEETFGKGAPPYRVFYDPDLQVVKQLGIEGGDLAYPTTVFIDEQGIVRYAYTGAHRADRPAADEIIEFIRGLDAKK
jgi:peroxiredoxin